GRVRPARGERGGELAGAAAEVDHVGGVGGAHPGEQLEERPGTLVRVPPVGVRVPDISRHRDEDRRVRYPDVKRVTLVTWWNAAAGRVRARRTRAGPAARAPGGRSSRTRSTGWSGPGARSGRTST